MPIFRRNRVRIAFGIALVVLTVAAIVSSWNVSRVLQTERQVSHANAVLDRLDDILEAFHDSVIASRGSASDAIQWHSQAVESMRSAIRDVRQGTIDNPEQQQRFRSLEGSLNQVIALERQRLEMTTRKGVDSSDYLFRKGPGLELLDRIRRTSSEIKSAEESLLSLGKEEQQRRKRTAEVVFFSSVLLGFVILLAVYYHLEREIGRRQRSESRLIHMNRLYIFLSQANEAIVRARKRDELFC
jgi:CHASE3 domain sensor protein